MLNSAVLEVTMAKRVDNRRLVVELFEDCCASFGEEQGEKIITMIINKLGGQRISMPDFDELYVLGRDRMIRRQYAKGISIAAIRCEWDVSERQIYRICSEE